MIGGTSIAQIQLGLSRLDTTRHIRRVETMHFGCVELVEQHTLVTTHLSRLARHVELVESCRDVA